MHCDMLKIQDGVAIVEKLNFVAFTNHIGSHDPCDFNTFRKLNLPELCLLCWLGGVTPPLPLLVAIRPVTSLHVLSCFT